MLVMVVKVDVKCLRPQCYVRSRTVRPWSNLVHTRSRLHLNLNSEDLQCPLGRKCRINKYQVKEETEVSIHITTFSLRVDTLCVYVTVCMVYVCLCTVCRNRDRGQEKSVSLLFSTLLLGDMHSLLIKPFQLFRWTGWSVSPVTMFTLLPQH